jgi:TatD DNase family protein
MIVDSHCHLDYPELQKDFQAVLARATTLDIRMFLTISTKLRDAEKILQIAHENPAIFCTMGVHPHEVETEGVPSFETLLSLTQRPKVVGIGETGLDYYYEHSPKDLQQLSFRHHIRVAKETGLPLIIHSRDAEEDILKILEEERIQDLPAPGVIHCFTGTKDFALKTMALGFYISISGIITFKKAQDLQDIVAHHVPLNRLLVETDSPYLAPVPHRGKPNEPSFVVHTVDKVAELKGVTPKEVGEITTENFFKLFNKAERPSS